MSILLKHNQSGCRDTRKARALQDQSLRNSDGNSRGVDDPLTVVSWAMTLLKRFVALPASFCTETISLIPLVALVSGIFCGLSSFPPSWVDREIDQTDLVAAQEQGVDCPHRFAAASLYLIGCSSLRLKELSPKHSGGRVTAQVI